MIRPLLVVCATVRIVDAVRMERVKNPIAELQFNVIFDNLPEMERTSTALNMNTALQESLSDALVASSPDLERSPVVFQEFNDVTPVLIDVTKPTRSRVDHDGGSSLLEVQQPYALNWKVLVEDLNQNSDLVDSLQLTPEIVNNALRKRGLLQDDSSDAMSVQSISLDEDHQAMTKLDLPSRVMVEVPATSLMQTQFGSGVSSGVSSRDSDMDMISKYGGKVAPGQFEAALNQRLAKIEGNLLNLAKKIRKSALECTMEVKHYAATKGFTQQNVTEINDWMNEAQHRIIEFYTNILLYQVARNCVQGEAHAGSGAGNSTPGKENDQGSGEEASEEAGAAMKSENSGNEAGTNSNAKIRNSAVKESAEENSPAKSPDSAHSDSDSSADSHSSNLHADAAITEASSFIQTGTKGEIIAPMEELKQDISMSDPERTTIEYVADALDKAGVFNLKNGTDLPSVESGSLEEKETIGSTTGLGKHKRSYTSDTNSLGYYAQVKSKAKKKKSWESPKAATESKTDKPAESAEDESEGDMTTLHTMIANAFNRTEEAAINNAGMVIEHAQRAARNVGEREELVTKFADYISGLVAMQGYCENIKIDLAMQLGVKQGKGKAGKKKEHVTFQTLFAPKSTTDPAKNNTLPLGSRYYRAYLGDEIIFERPILVGSLVGSSLFVCMVVGMAVLSGVSKEGKDARSGLVA